ncbi:hypothetical protein EV122DRAFT_208557 [Schizophyllum commune]
MAVALEDIVQLSADIKALAKRLPQSVPIASKDGKIYRVMQETHGESAWATFNKRFDSLYGMDCWDTDGNLRNIERGKYGIDGVCKYLDIAVQQKSMPYDLMALKLQRLKLAMEGMWCPATPPILPKPKRNHTADTKKGAVDALRMVGDGSLASYLIPTEGAFTGSVPSHFSYSLWDSGPTSG